MTLRLQNKTELRFTHPNIGSMCSFIRFENERELQNAFHKKDNYYSITYGGKMATITIDFMEMYDNYIYVIVNYKILDEEYIHKYSCVFDDKLKRFLLSF